MSVREKVPATTANGRLHAPKKLSLACGQAKPEGFFGVDYANIEGVDLVHDLLQFPWPIKTGVVQEINCSHFVEHIPHWRPGFTKDGWFHFFDEVFRISKKGAVCTFIHPYAMNARAFWDPTHERYIHETAWYYLSKGWRTMQNLDHYQTDVDFEVIVIEGLGVPEEIQVKHHEAQAYARNHYWNVISDLLVRLKVVK